MSLLLISGRPGAGKTEFGTWLETHRGFRFIESDKDWERWGPVLCVPGPDQARATVARARDLGPRVAVEWGFFPELLPCVERLRAAGFDAWWFDGDPDELRQGYIARRGGSASIIAYEAQVQKINNAWDQLQTFYTDHIVQTVKRGPKYLPLEEIASRVFPAGVGSDGIQ